MQQSKAFVMAQIKRLKDRAAQERTIREHAALLTAMSEGTWGGMVPRMPDEPGWHAEKARRLPFAPNIFGFALDRTATLYNEEPTRVLETDGEGAPDEEGREFWTQRLWRYGAGLSVAMDEADRKAKVHGTCLLYAYYKTHPDAPRDVRALAAHVLDQAAKRAEERAARRAMDPAGAMARADEADGRTPHGDGADDTDDAPPDMPPLPEGEEGIEVIAISRERFTVLPNELDERVGEAFLIHLDSPDSTSTQGVRYDVHKCAQIAQALPGSPTRGDATTHTSSSTTTTGCGALFGQSAPSKEGTGERHLYWDRRYVALLHNWEPQPLTADGDKIIEHGLGDHPFVVVRNREAGLDFYSAPWGGTDLWDNLRAIGAILREYGWTARLQRGQPWIKGETRGPIRLSPDGYIHLEANPNADFGIEKPGGDLDGIKTAATTLIELLARTLNMPSRAFRIDSVSMSGVAIALDNSSIEDGRQARARQARGWEGALHRKAQLIWRAATGEDRPGLSSVSYRAQPIFLTFEQKMSRLRYLDERGLISPLDQLRELYPHLSDAELTAWHERAKEAEQERYARDLARALEKARQLGALQESGTTA